MNRSELSQDIITYSYSYSLAIHVKDKSYQQLLLSSV